MLEGEIKDLRGKQLPSSNLNVETEETGPKVKVKVERKHYSPSQVPSTSKRKVHRIAMAGYQNVTTQKPTVCSPDPLSNMHKP